MKRLLILIIPLFFITCLSLPSTKVIHLKKDNIQVKSSQESIYEAKAEIIELVTDEWEDHPNFYKIKELLSQESNAIKCKQHVHKQRYFYIPLIIINYDYHIEQSYWECILNIKL